MELSELVECDEKICVGACSSVEDEAEAEEMVEAEACGTRLIELSCSSVGVESLPLELAEAPVLSVGVLLLLFVVAADGVPVAVDAVAGDAPDGVGPSAASIAFLSAALISPQSASFSPAPASRRCHSSLCLAWALESVFALRFPVACVVRHCSKVRQSVLTRCAGGVGCTSEVPLDGVDVDIVSGRSSSSFFRCWFNLRSFVRSTLGL